MNYCLIPPGNGKTYIVAKLILYEQNRDAEANLLVFVKDELLASQMKVTFAGLFAGSRLSITGKYDPVLHGVPSVAIIDEADWQVEHRLVEAERAPARLTGLSIIRLARKVYMLSGTVNVFVSEVLKEAFGESQVHFRQFPS